MRSKTEGYSETKAMEEADLVILNTCHIREKAAEKVYSELGRVRELKQRARGRRAARPRIVVAGCVAQAEGREILRRAPAVDVVVGPQNYHRLPDLPAEGRAERVVDTEFPVEDKFDHLPAPARARIRSRGVSAFLTIQEGCDKFCTFCVVPYTRGAEVSRPVARILDEARAPRGGGRARADPDRPERERLSRRGAGRRRLVARPPAAPPGGGARASRACATRRAIRATWTRS